MRKPRSQEPVAKRVARGGKQATPRARSALRERTTPRCDTREVEWTHEIEPRSRPVDVYLTLSPARTRVKGVAFGDQPLAELPGRKLRVLKLPKLEIREKQRLRFRVDAVGELPAITALSVQEPAADAAEEIEEVEERDERGVGEVGRQLAAKYQALLDARATEPFEKYREERRFFLRFDAWTNASVAEWLVGRDHETFGTSLCDEARQLFVNGMPDPFRDGSFVFDDPSGLTHLAEKLYGVALSRGHALPDGGRLRHDLGDRDVELAFLRPAKSLKQAIRRVATFLRAIFAPLDGPAAAPHAGLTRLEVAFALFASGHLHFLPKDEKDSIKTLLNCEPDSGFFFCFAEFALRACKAVPDQARYWFPIARLFVALEDAFLETYGPQVGPHSFSKYQREKRWEPLLPIEMVTDHVRWFRSEHPDASSLAELAMKHSANALHAAKDDVFKPRARPAALQRAR